MFTYTADSATHYYPLQLFSANIIFCIFHCYCWVLDSNFGIEFGQIRYWSVMIFFSASLDEARITRHWFKFLFVILCCVVIGFMNVNSMKILCSFLCSVYFIQLLAKKCWLYLILIRLLSVCSNCSSQILSFDSNVGCSFCHSTVDSWYKTYGLPVLVTFMYKYDCMWLTRK